MRNIFRSNTKRKQSSLNYSSSKQEQARSLAASCKKKPYSCRICHKSFQTHSILADHSVKDHPQQQHEYHHHYYSSLAPPPPPPPIPRRRETTVSQSGQNRSPGTSMTSVFGHPCPVCQRIFASVHDRDAHQRTSHPTQTTTQITRQTPNRADNNFLDTSLSTTTTASNAATSSPVVASNKHGHSRRRSAASSGGNLNSKSSPSPSTKMLRHNASSTSSSSSKPFQCDVCTRTFTRLSHLIAHEQIHSAEKRFKCSECGKEFLRAASLSEHQRCHAEQK